MEIYDRLRRRFVVCTPEERVRQWLVHNLIKCYGYKEGYMANEVGIRLNHTLKRCDTVVYNNLRTPVMIIEYKRPDVDLSHKVIEQVLRYNMVLKARFLAISNGHYSACYRIDYQANRATPLSQFPPFSELITPE